MKNDKQQKHHTGFAQATLFEHGWQPCLYWVTFLIDPFQRRDRVIDWKVCLSVCLSVPHHFSLSEYWIIWWFTPCKPYIFLTYITLPTTSALFWPSTNQECLTQILYHQVPTSTALYWPCKPNIFWEHITLATSTALSWSSITIYRPVPSTGYIR